MSDVPVETPCMASVAWRLSMHGICDPEGGDAMHGVSTAIDCFQAKAFKII